MAERMAHEEGRQEGVVGIVCSGAGARGAYEAGVLSVLLPLLEGADAPRIVVGTSAGALNAAMLASAIDRGVDPVAALTTEGWETISPERIFATPRLSLLRSAKRWLRRPWGVAPGLLDTGALRTTLEQMLPDPRFASAVARGALDAVAVVASSCSSGNAVVFCESKGRPESRTGAGVVYVTTDLGIDHLMASSAFPLAFPACWVGGPEQGWYIDGGVHLNTPIKPAIDLGADRILVIGGTPSDISQPSHQANPPNLMDGSGQLLHAMLVDTMQADLGAIAGINRDLHGRSTVPEPSNGGHRFIEFCAVNPQNDYLSEVAAQTWPSGMLPFLRSLGGYSALGPMTSQRQRPGQFLSYLCFNPEYLAEAIACGRNDATRLIGDSKRIPWRSE